MLEGGADSILFDFSGSTTSATNLIIKGGAGRDTITLSGADGAAVANLAGGDGGDLITLNGTGTFSPSAVALVSTPSPLLLQPVPFSQPAQR